MTPDTLIAVASPPPCAQRMASDDSDEVTSWVARRDGDHSRVVHGPGPYGFRLARIETQSVQVAWASTRLANTLRARFRRPTFHFPLRGIQHYAYGRRRIEVGTGGLVFISAGTEATRHSEGYPLLAIELEASAFESEVQKRHGTDRVEWPRVPQVLELSEPQRDELLEAITELVHVQQPGASAPSRTHGESRLLSALAGVLTGSASGGITPVSIQRHGRRRCHGDRDQPRLHAPRALLERLSRGFRRIAIAGSRARPRMDQDTQRRSVSPRRRRTVATP